MTRKQGDRGTQETDPVKAPHPPPHSSPQTPAGSRSVPLNLRQERGRVKVLSASLTNDQLKNQYLKGPTLGPPPAQRHLLLSGWLTRKSGHTVSGEDGPLGCVLKMSRDGQARALPGTASPWWLRPRQATANSLPRRRSVLPGRPRRPGSV